MKKQIAFFEIFLIIVTTISFAYFLNENFPTVKAEESFKGCCLETKEGAICQDIPFIQSDFCKTSLIPSLCSSVEECKKGCCYSPSTGTCVLNSPKNKCLENGGNWSNDSSCNIPQCQVGCCILGDQVSLTNSRECSLLSNKYNFEKKFVQIQPGESCEKYIGQEKRGACLADSGDFSGEKKCVYTTKKNCKGEFKEGYLCTSKELNTICKPTKKTTCVEGKDQVYYLDSCGNIANIYDASKFNDQSYWEKPISPENSCSPESAGCGNCDYIKGSICTKYEEGKTTKPTFGEYVCKSLHCGERKHGESWCVYDFNPNEIAPVGSRHFIARCFEGQISIEGCADFMQEICAQTTDNSFGFTEAKCMVNDWRSCINANDADSYEEVKKKCDENPQCVMFNERYGEDKLKRSDGKFLAGFDPEKTNSEQGAIGDLGKDQNKVLAHCVPRFTPGFQFWTTNTKIVGASSSSKKPSTANYGGSNEETNALCSLGSFVCISQMHRDCTLGGGCDDWEDNERNWECNIDGVNQNIKTKDLPALLAALNERCRSIGSCGVSSNIAGKVNEDNSTIGFTIKRIKIDRKGKTQENYDSSGYILSGDYISSIKKSTRKITKLEGLKKSGIAGLTAGDADSAGTSGEISGGEALSLKDLAREMDVGKFKGINPLVNLGGVILTTIGTTYGFSSLASYGTYTFGMGGAGSFNILPSSSGYGILGSGSLGAGLSTALWSVVGYFIGAQVGNLIAKNQDWSPGKQQQFVNFVGAIGSTIGATVGISLTTGLSSAWSAATATYATAGGSFSGFFAGAGAFLATNPIGWAILIATIAYTIYTAFFDKYEEQEYYIMQFTCESWKPPKESQCELCNEDVRPCSEYRCKSLGSKCHYFVDNGEPGYCATINEIWSAKITPWQEVLTEGNKYSDVKSNGFKVTSSMGGGVEAWTHLTFGIITDKPATCRIDFEHTKSYDDMRYEMESPINPDTGRADGLKHKITLSPHLNKENSSTTTLGMTIGEENEYYIRCMNFAGQVNEAEFVVQIKVKEGPDLTPPEIRRFLPEQNTYLKKGTNLTSLILYLNEPAECRYIQEYDVVNGEEGFNEMPNNMTCLTDQSSAIYGEWTCFTILQNLTPGLNKFYFRCKDQPSLEGRETENYKRNVNLYSKEYKINVCNKGVEISLLNPTTLIEEKNFILSIGTRGCTEKSYCHYRIFNFSSSFNQFFTTGGNTHSQPLILNQGDYEIEVMCEDGAKNIANKTFNFSVFFDDVEPKILRVINEKGKITVITDEEAECYYYTNSTELCDFSMNNEIKYLSKIHSFNSNPLETYYIKCRDKKFNSPKKCSTIIKPLNLKN